MATKQDKQELPSTEYGALVHTAMRKLMDSKESSYAWNVVHLLSSSWTRLCQQWADAGARTGPELKAVFEKMEWWEGESKNESFYARQIFRIALEDMDDDDWDGMAGYLAAES